MRVIDLKVPEQAIDNTCVELYESSCFLTVFLHDIRNTGADPIMRLRPQSASLQSLI